MSLESLHWCYVWSIMLTSCEPPCCPPESKKSPLNTYQPELHLHSFHCREISVDRFLCCLQRVANWLRNNSGCFCETLKANRESPAHVWHWKITSLIKLFQSSFLKLSHPRTGDPVSKKERWWSSGAESVCCVEQRHESWILAYQGCLVGFDVRRVWPLPRCPRRCLFFNLWRPQSNLCDPTVVLFRGNTSHVVKSSSAPLLRLNERLSPEVLFESLPFPPIFLMTEDSCRVAAVSNLCAFDWWLTLFLYW